MLTTLDFSAKDTPQTVGAAVRRIWPESKVVHLRGIRPDGDLRDFYWQVFEEIGEALPYAEDARIGDRNSQRTGGYWLEVRYDPSVPDAYRHSANAQPLHTDLSYVPTPNAVGFLSCVAMPPEGGATTFIDSADLIEALSSEDPQLLEKLSSTVLPHSRSGDSRAEQVIRMVGEKALLNWNYYCVDPAAGPEAEDLRQRFFRFLQGNAAVAAKTKRVKLAPGEAVLWKDEEVLHGRDSFDAEKPSERFLWKAALLVDA